MTAPTLLPLLDDEAIEAGLLNLPEWTRDGEHLVREHSASSARAAIRTLQRIGDVAEGANHHPELFWVYDRITLRLTTHDSGGVTALDVRVAGVLDDVLHDG